MDKEARIRIGDVELDSAQSMAVRVAVGDMLSELEDPRYRHELGEIAGLYQARLDEVQALIFAGLK